MKTRTVKGELVAAQTDSMGYTTYVFKLLDPDEIEEFGFKYIMCTRWPNWDHRDVRVGEIGYISYTEIIAGEDFWLDRSGLVPYKCSTVQFNKFITEPPKVAKTFKL